jgi:uncharacterized protein (DUF362 family)
MYRAFIDRLDGGYEASIRRGLERIGILQTLKSADRVVIKPNLTFPTFRKGVMTNPEAVEALIRVLADHTSNITIGESDSGGYNPFSMHDVFQATGLDAIARRYGVRIVNLSHEVARSVIVKTALRRLAVPLPLIVVEHADLFITMPVPKIHMNTRVSMSIKNQWGVIQSPALRLKLHPYFTQVVYGVNKALPRAISIIDGCWSQITSLRRTSFAVT